MMSKAELARKAGLSSLTIDRVEAGRACRLDTKRKILLALGLKVSDKAQVFGSTRADRGAAPEQPASTEITRGTARSMERDEGSPQESSQAKGGYES
jgi:DNA-binding XRE family transcriptional regulator